MHQKLKVFCFVFFVLFPALASFPVQAAGNLGAASDAPSPVWKIEGSDSVLYLLGSFHLLDNVGYRDNPSFRKAFEDADVVIFETDIAGLESPSVKQIIRSRGLYYHGKSLRKEISPETYRSLEAAAAGLGIPMESLNVLRPWLCAVTITALKYSQLGFLSENGVDAYFFKEAERAGKEVVALETPEYQVSLFAELSLQEQEQMLAQTLEDLELFEEKVNSLVAAWSTGDAEGLNRILLENFRRYPAIYRRLVTERNRRWLSRIEPLLQEGETVLVIVGAAHLVGPDGLLRLLKDRGYRVAQQ